MANKDPLLHIGSKVFLLCVRGEDRKARLLYQMLHAMQKSTMDTHKSESTNDKKHSNAI